MARLDRSAIRACAVLLGVCAPALAAALDADLSVDYTGEYSTNTALTATDEIDEWVHLPGADLSLNQSGAALELDAAYRFERRIYEKDLFDNESAVRGTSEAIWHALPERLDFRVRNTRAESTIRARQPNTEVNRQTVSVTEGGPTLRLRPQTNAELQLEYLYTDIAVEETETDSERQTGAVRYIVDLSATRTVTLEGTWTDVDFDNPLAPDLEATIGMVMLDQAGRNISYTVGAGYNRTKRELGRDTVDGAIFDGSIEWNARPATSFELTASREIRDQSSSLLTGGGGFGDEIDEDTDINEVFVETRGMITWNQRLGANELSISALGSQEDYEDVTRDSERVAGRLSLTRALNPRTELSASIEVGTREFTDEDDEFDEIRGDLELRRRMSRRFSLAVGARYEERQSDGIADTSYDEWVGRIVLRYSLLGATGPRR
ncbi:MAG: hypothetical protein GVY21_10145 [Gammaproteobacteria bacterium]|jgi:hypothetical protein|nr:hypothetical protein [Gammaproteobacteria bacterium]